MDSSANFTNPTNQTDPTNTRGTGDNGEVWNPTGGPNGTGAWEAPPPAAPVHHTADPFFGAVWGNRNQDTVNGKPVAGTSGAELDTARYAGLARQNVAAPTIDQAQSNESRGLSLGALGLLGARAGGATTPADIQAQQQTTGAVNAIRSGAASVRGGAGARAAAARGAIAQGATTQAIGDQNAAALHAQGVANAAGQYFNAASAQRQRDLGLANNQASLIAKQREQNQQNQQFFEGLGWNTKNAQQQAGLGLSLSDQAAANAGRQAAFQANQQAWGRGSDIASGTSGLISGIGAGYNASQTGSTPSDSSASSDNGGEPDPWADYSGSDPRTKTAIRPVSDAEAGRLLKAGNMIQEGMRASLAASGGKPEAPKYDGKYLPGLAYSDAPDVVSGSQARAEPPKLLDAIAARVATDDANAPRYGYFDEAEGGARTHLGANPGYAASRAGQPGGMFGAPRIAAHGFEPAKHSPELARDIAMSDPRAKAVAWDEGRQAAIAQMRDAAQMTPEDLKRHADTTPEVAAVRDIRAGSWDEGRRSTKEGAAQDAREWMQRYGVKEAPAAGSPIEDFRKAPSPTQAPAPAPAVAPEPSYFGQLANRAKAALYTPSDPRTKQDVHDSPMAAANRSMVPSVYEYRAEFTPPEQAPGEKNVGPMADKMKANPIAATAIVKDPQTGMLAIDKTKGLKLVMGGLADLQRQVDQMKGRAR